MRIIRFIAVIMSIMAVSAAAASAQVSLLVSVDVNYPDGSDSTFYYVTSSMEAAVEAAGVAQSEISNMMTIHNEDTIGDFMKHFQDRFPKIEMWFMISAVKESENPSNI